jgi:hypothetical protein
MMQLLSARRSYGFRLSQSMLEDGTVPVASTEDRAWHRDGFLVEHQ